MSTQEEGDAELRGAPREPVRHAAAMVLRTTPRPLHYSELAGVILPSLGLQGRLSPKSVNNILHQDPEKRFRRVGRGLWVLDSKGME